MSAILVEEEIQVPPQLKDGGRRFDDLRPEHGWEGGEGGDRSSSLYQTGVWVLLIPIVMFFLGLTSSLVVRQGASDDWQPIQIPEILGLNTALLLASSLALEKARRVGNSSGLQQMRPWLWLTNVLGLCFLAGQLVAWKQMADQGVFLATNPSSSFFYILTGMHGAHLLGGMAALLYLTLKSVHYHEFGARRQSALKAAAVYWHFVGVLWVYLLFLLVFWR